MVMLIIAVNVFVTRN